MRARDSLGSYRLRRQLALGSMCQVWEAIHEESQQSYALKVLRPEIRTNKTELMRLRWEYQVGSQLSHPNIINMLDFVSTDRTPFLTLELFEGMDLKRLLERDTDRLGRVVIDIMKQTAQALKYLHDKGYIHCVVSPSNIMVDRNARVKLIDLTLAQKKPLGLFKIFAGRARVPGNRHYMSPELIRARRPDERSDIYSLGCTFYELLSGEVPYREMETEGVLFAYLSPPHLPMVSSRDSISEDRWRACKVPRCLAIE